MVRKSTRRRPLGCQMHAMRAHFPGFVTRLFASSRVAGWPGVAGCVLVAAGSITCPLNCPTATPPKRHRLRAS